MENSGGMRADQGWAESVGEARSRKENDRISKVQWAWNLYYGNLVNISMDAAKTVLMVCESS